MGALKQSEEVLGDLFVKNKHLIGVRNLAEMLGTDTEAIALALKIERKIEELEPSNKAVRKWMKVFNLILEMIKQAEPDISKDKASLKLKRWLHIPQIQLENEAPISYMLKGKTRQLISYLEQLVL
jgi:hypothetical protein